MTSRRRPRPWHASKVLPGLSALAVAAMLSAAAIAPSAASSVSAVGARDAHGTQELDGLVAAQLRADGVREGFTSEAAPPPVVVAAATARTAPAAGIPDPGSAMSIGYQMVLDRGWDASEFDCLAALWDRESRWDVYAFNASSGAYGIPQALPGEKMAAAGDDWQTNPATQISWGLSYIANRYGSPCGAWAFSEQRGWY